MVSWSDVRNSQKFLDCGTGDPAINCLEHAYEGAVGTDERELLYVELRVACRN